MFDENALRAAGDLCVKNRKEIERSVACGCFYCLEIFAPSAVERWLNEGDGTALCPECQIDSVIGDASGYPAADVIFLREMQNFWYGPGAATSPIPVAGGSA